MHDGVTPAALCPADARLVMRLHGDLPLVDRPFAAVGAELGLGESTVIERLRLLLAQGLLTRLGPLFQIERAGGRFVLAAMAVPEDRFDAVAAQVNALPEVAHNYRRTHALNQWFVLGTATPEGVRGAIARIEADTGLPVLAFPKEREYFVELRLPLDGSGPPPMPARWADAPAPATPPAPGPAAGTLDPEDQRLIAATQAGLPLVERPWEALGAVLGCDGEAVTARLRDMLARGLVRRIGAVPHHVRLGWTANGMTVWDVDDARVDELGERVGALPGVSHCYRRPRHGAAWPYNLFAMLHGRHREEVESQRRALARLLGPACRAHDVLYSTAVLKKTGLRLPES